VARLADPDDGRVALVDITEAGQALLDARKQFRRERLAVLLEELSPEDRNALALAACVAMPILNQLAEKANSQFCRLTAGEDASAATADRNVSR
jgi:DNA-binding MarR family transcriptional regulator